MMKIDTRTEDGEMALRVWGSSDPNSKPEGAFAPLLEWDALLEEVDRASLEIKGGRRRG